MRKTTVLFGVMAALLAITVSIGFTSCETEPDDPGDTRPDLTGTVTIDITAPKVGQTLTASYDNVAGNGTGTATWVWLANDVAIANTNSETYVVAAGDLSKTLKARVSFADQKGSVTSAATVAVAANSDPVLTGTVSIDIQSPKVGDTLTADYSGGNGSGTAIWQWYRGTDTGISNSNNATYVVDIADLGQTLKARVSYAVGFQGFVESAETDAVAKATLTGTVSITGTVAVGDTLTAAYTGGNGSGVQTWKWLANDVEISTANAITYEVALSDVGKTLKARVSFANQDGFVTSNATATVPDPDASIVPTHFIIAAGSDFQAKKGDTYATATDLGSVGTLAATLSAIRTDANGADVVIQFGDGTTPLATSAVAVFDTQTPAWGVVTLTGKITTGNNAAVSILNDLVVNIVDATFSSTSTTYGAASAAGGTVYMYGNATVNIESSTITNDNTAASNNGNCRAIEIGYGGNNVTPNAVTLTIKDSTLSITGSTAAGRTLYNASTGTAKASSITLLGKNAITGGQYNIYMSQWGSTVLSVEDFEAPDTAFSIGYSTGPASNDVVVIGGKDFLTSFNVTNPSGVTLKVSGDNLIRE